MSLLELWWQFIKIGVAAFGGLGITLSLIDGRRIHFPETSLLGPGVNACRTCALSKTATPKGYCLLR